MLGLDFLDAAINQGNVPDSRFFPWQGQIADASGAAIEHRLEALRQVLERPASIWPKRDRLLAEEVYGWLIRPAEERGS